MTYQNGITGFSLRRFEAPLSDGPVKAFDIYERGEGPVVVLLQELPGICPATIKFANKMVDAGFSVVMPHLFGPLGRFALVRNFARLFCMRREINIFSKRQTSPIVEWLKALCLDVKQRHEVEGVGVIGMCLTGNFAISLMADNNVLAAVASQPSLPVFAPTELHMSEQDIKDISKRLDEHGPMLAYRFEGDKLCTKAKFDALEETFNSQGKKRIKLNTLEGDQHAVLTSHFITAEGSPTQAALDELITYFQTKLSA